MYRSLVCSTRSGSPLRSVRPAARAIASRRRSGELRATTKGKPQQRRNGGYLMSTSVLMRARFRSALLPLSDTNDLRDGAA